MVSPTQRLYPHLKLLLQRKNKIHAMERQMARTQLESIILLTELTRLLEFLKGVIHQGEMDYYGCSGVLCIQKHVTFLRVLLFFFT